MATCCGSAPSHAPISRSRAATPERRAAARGTRPLRTRLAALLASAAVATAAPALAQVPPDSPVPVVLRRLDLDLAVDYERATVAGTATLTLRNLSPRNVGAVTLLLNRLMTVGGVTGVDGAPVPFVQQVVLFRDDSTLQVDAITVTPRAPVASGDSLTIAVRYGGALVGYVETGSLYIRDHVSREFTILREDAYAFPVLGVASRRANRAAPRDPFAFAARVTVPADLVVAMGGEQVERTARDSLVRWGYRSTAPVPFLNIAIAPYRVREHAGTRIFFFPADSLGARSVDDAIAGAVDRYGRWFGPLGAEARLTVMEIPEGYGSQASLAAGILQTADAFRDRAQLRQLYHELSHLWNVEDRERPSPRWNEGLASFLERRVAAELDGWSDWDSLLARVEQRIRRACTSDAGCGATPFASYGTAGRTDLSYSVGFAMFYALYRTLGADAFDRAYRDFYQAHRGTGAASQDLAAAFHRADARSDAVFADWFTTTRWYARLVAGESLARIAESYRR